MKLSATAEQVLLISAQDRQEYLNEAQGREFAGDLGIRYLGAALEDAGISVSLLPAHFNTDDEVARRVLLNEELILVGVSVHISSLSSTKKKLERIKELRPDLPVVVGGFLPTFSAEQLVRDWPEVDFVVGGEGEQALVALCHAVLAGEEPVHVPALTWRRSADGAIIHNKPVRSPMETGLYARPIRRTEDMPSNSPDVMVSASRGCYGRCTFCSVPVFDGRGWRGREPHQVAAEVAMVVREFGTGFVNFVDDSFFGASGRIERAIDMRDALASEGVKVPFRISLRANDVKKDTIGPLKEAGLVAVQLGVESFSERQLVRVFKKGVRPETNRRAIAILEQHGIHVQIGLILFEPTTSLDDLAENAKAILESGDAVTKGLSQRLFCAQGTVLADQLLAEKASLGLDSMLNHKWAFHDPAALRVFDLVNELEAACGHVGNELLALITPPNAYSGKLAGLVFDLYKRYKNWSVDLLLAIVEAVRAGEEDGSIRHSITDGYWSTFEAIEAELQVLRGKLS